MHAKIMMQPPRHWLILEILEINRSIYEDRKRIKCEKISDDL